LPVRMKLMWRRSATAASSGGGPTDRGTAPEGG
jgi:hypothetical protein